MKKKTVTYKDKDLGLSSIATLLSGWSKRISESEVKEEMTTVETTLVEKQKERNEASVFSAKKK
jgi:hypothetical protein